MADKVRIGIDAMGGHFAPKNEIEGALLAQVSLKAEYGKTVEFVLFGVEENIRKVAAENKIDISAFTIVDSPDVIDMHDDPSRIVAMSFCEPRSCIGRLSS